jgi:hypothetical protein
MPSIDDLPAPLPAFYHAFQKGDLDTLRTLYATGAELRDPGVGFLLGHADLVAAGPENIARYYYQAFSNMPTPPVIALERHWQAGSDVFVEYTEGMMRYLEIFSIADGKIAGQQVFWGSIPPAPLMRRTGA